MTGQFVVFDHPKFGLIPCISTIADIEEGEEVINPKMKPKCKNVKHKSFDMISTLSSDPCGIWIRSGRVPRVVQGGVFCFIFVFVYKVACVFVFFFVFL